MKIYNKMLKYPPLRYTNNDVPDVLIYRPISKFKDVYDVVMFKTDGSNSRCNMYCMKETTSKKENPNPSLLIAMLSSKPRKQGLGRKMLKYAQQMSREMGCEGRIVLCADPRFTPKEVPHIFYRKCGLNTESEEINNKLDEFIESGKTATIKDFQKEMMYYPPVKTVPKENPPQKLSLWDKIRIHFETILRI